MDEKRQLIYSAISSHHASNVLEKLYFQFKEGRNCDLEIRVQDGYIFAHKCLIEIFFSQAGLQLENDRFMLDLSEFSDNIVTPLLDMIYTGELRINPLLIHDVQSVAAMLGFTEAEKGCSIYHSNCSDSDTMQYTVVKQEPIDDDAEYSASSDDFTSKKELHDFASKYVEQFGMDPAVTRAISSSESSPSPDPKDDLRAKMSSVSTSKNIYEVVKGQPKDLKLPNIVVMTANKIASNRVQPTVDTAPADRNERDPYLLVTRREDGIMVLKKEMDLKKGIRDIVEKPVAVMPKTKGKSGYFVGKTEPKKAGNTSDKPAVVPVMLTSAKIGQNCEVLGTVPSVAKGKKKSAFTATTTGAKVKFPFTKSADSGVGTSCNLSDDEKPDSEPEEEVTPSKRPRRAAKRPVVYMDKDYDVDFEELDKRKRGRPAKPALEKEMMKEYEAIMKEKTREGTNTERPKPKSFTERRHAVVVQKQEYKSKSLKLVEPAGSVPEGCRSRYGQPGLMKTKYVTETVKGLDGSVSVRTKEVPMRMTWHERQAEEKKSEEPTFVICHPTAPVVRT